MPNEIYKGEIQLAGWSETHTGGAKVTFWLPDADALANFRELTTRKGNTAGQILACMIMTVDCHDEPANPVNQEVAANGFPLARLAAMFTRDKLFLEWCGASSPDLADLFIKGTCGIISKRELDMSKGASDIFHSKVRKPFIDWKVKNGRVEASCGN